MTKKINLTTLMLACLTLFLTNCKKNEIDLIGSASKADFSFLQAPASDTLPYPYNVAFTNNSTEAFLYQWNFGDNSALSSEQNPVHTYKAGGTFNVTLTTVGTYGNSSITKFVGVSDACHFLKNLSVRI